MTFRACGVRLDHPRSRGVYPTRSSPSPMARGSSPLARGLRLRLAYRPRTPGIIPARAGFTSMDEEAIGQLEDHPRSRGVYSVEIEESPQPGGSSPLARGLLYPHSSVSFITRIIPARAGFTGQRDSHRASCRDHPRSRGVYARAVALVGRAFGSSPLARGLLGDRRLRDGSERIIPARAGFTPGTPCGAP